jgi:DNA-binding NarL/FixJ family response regulator
VKLTARAEALGREYERGALAAAVAELAGGRGGAAWISGPAGIGKSALIGAGLDEAAARGVPVLRAAGDELSAAFPLRMLADALGVSRRSADPARMSLAAALSQAELGQAGPGGPDLGREILAVARDVAGAGPVVLAADDLQWADEASLALWPALIELTTQFPLLLLGAARPAPGRPVLSTLPETVRRRGGPVLFPWPLDAAVVAEIVAPSLGAAPGPRLRAELDRAGGNPRYAQELAGALAAAGLIEQAGEVAEFTGEPGTTPAPLAASVERGLGFLSEETLGTVRMAAVLGDDCTLADLAAVTGRPDHDLRPHLAEAVGAEVLDSAPLATGNTLLRFRQPLVREALTTRILPAVGPALHRHAARILADSGRRLPTVAPHLLAGPAAMEDWALRWLSVRSEASLYQVPQAAVELLETAVQMVDQEDSRWEAFAGKLAQAAFWLGRDDGVVPMALEVARRTSDVGLACRMRIYAMQSAARSGRYPDGIAVGEAALRDPALPSAWRARVSAWLAVLLLLTGQTRQGEAKAFEAVRQAALSADPVAMAYAHQAAALQAGTADAMVHADTALAALGNDTESADLRLSLLRNRLLWLMRLDDDRELEHTLSRALTEAERTGTFRSAGIRGAAAHIRYRQGRWDEALDQLGRIEPEFRGLGEAIRLRALSALITLRRGDQTEAAAQLSAASAAEPPSLESAVASGGHLVVTRALAAEARGDLDEARETVRGLLAMPGPQRRLLDSDDAPDLVRVTLAADAPRIAEALVAALEEDAAADPVAGRILAARCGRAQLDGDPATLTAVARDYQQRGWPVRRGLAMEEAAVRLAAAGHPVQARAALAAAADAYAIPGATWDARRAEARLRRHGIRRGPRSAHRTEATGWAALTPAEARVALLAVDGLSNADIATRLFVSQRTVEAHVSRILAKLQIRSRAELARAHADQAPDQHNRPR